MRICKGLAGAMLLVAMLVGANVAKADTVYGHVWMDYESRIGGSVYVNTNDGEMSGYEDDLGLGEFKFAVTGFGDPTKTATPGTPMEILLAKAIDWANPPPDPMYGYCIDTGQYLDEGDNQYEIRTLEDIFELGGVTDSDTWTARSEDLRYLYGTHLGSVGTTAEKLAFGIAVWEIAFEDSSGIYGYDPDDGDFAVTAGTWDQDLVDTYLSDWTTRDSDVFALYDPVNQDFSVVIDQGFTVVPEPFTMATAFLAISSFGMYIRKHTRKGKRT